MQTTYQKIPDPSFQGMLADNGLHDVASAAYEAKAAGSAPFGVGMVVGSSDAQCALPSGANDVFLGVAAHRFIAPGTVGSNAFTGEQGIEDTQTVDALRKGRIWVVVEDAVDPGDSVFVRHTANGAGKLQLGAFRGADNDGGKAIDVSAFCAWRSTTTGAGLAVLEVNAP